MKSHAAAAALVLLCAGLAICHGRSTRIVGGHQAHVGDISPMVSVKYQEGLFDDPVHICGGAIVNDNHILTSASCVDGIDTSFLRASGGDLHLSLVETFQEDKRVNEVFIHPDYDSLTKANNLAILRTSHNFIFVHDTIEATTLPEDDTELPTGSILTMAGWGTDKYEGLQHMHLWINNNMTYMTSEECSTNVYGDTLASNCACITGTEGNGICDLDEGGPVIDASGVQVGVINWHSGCDAHPGVITRTAPYKEWIQSHFDT